MLIQLRIELEIPVAIGPAFRRAIQPVRRTTWSVRSAADNSGDKRGVSNPRTGSGTASWQKQGVAHAPAPLLTVARDVGARHRAPRERCGNEPRQLARRQSLGRVANENGRLA